MQISLALSPTNPLITGGGLRAPAGYLFLVDTDGYYLTDTDGYYLVELI